MTPEVQGRKRKKIERTGSLGHHHNDLTLPGVFLCLPGLPTGMSKLSRRRGGVHSGSPSLFLKPIRGRNLTVDFDNDGCSTITFRLLGPPSVRLGEKLIRLSPQNLSFMLLIRLLLESPHRFRRVDMALQMWPDSPTPMNNMRQLLFRMKPVLDEMSPVFEMDRDWISIKNPELVLLDVKSFQFPFRCLVPHPPDSCPSCFSDLEHSLSLYRGSFLEGWSLTGTEPFDEWAINLRNQLENLALDRLRQVVKYCRSHGDLQKALFHARLMASVNPEEESFQAELFDVLEEAGCQEEILERFRRIRSRCQELFGTEPEERIRSIYERANNFQKTQSPLQGLKNADPSEWRPMAFLAVSLSFLTLQDPEEQFQWAHKIIGLCKKWIRYYGGTTLQNNGTLIVGSFGHQIIQEYMSLQVFYCAIQIKKEMQAIEAHTHGVSVCMGLHGERILVQSGNTSASFSEGVIRAAISLSERAAPFEILATGPIVERAKGHVETQPMVAFPLKREKDPSTVHRVISTIGTRQHFSLLGADSGTPLIGRKDELERLMGVWEKVLQCQCAIFGIRGEKGIGKSRLLYHFLKKARTSPVLIRKIFCRPESQASPFSSILDEIRDSFGVETHLYQASLDRIFDTIGIRFPSRNRMGKVLSQLMGITLIDGRDKNPIPQEKLHQDANDLLTRFLLRRTNKIPLIVAVENIHWADPDTVRILREIGSSPPPAPFLLLFTSREVSFNRNQEFASVEHIRLEPLAFHETQRLIKKMDPQREIPPANREKIGMDSDGIPLFIEELVRHHKKGSPHPISVPQPLEDYLNHRLQMAGTGRFLLGKAAMLGKTFSRDLLFLFCSEEEQRDFDSRIEGLIRTQFLQVSESGGTLYYSFCHTLFRYMAYTSMTDRTKREIRLRATELLESKTKKSSLFSRELLDCHLELLEDEGKSSPNTPPERSKDEFQLIFSGKIDVRNN